MKKLLVLVCLTIAASVAPTVDTADTDVIDTDVQSLLPLGFAGELLEQLAGHGHGHGRGHLRKP